MEFYDSCLNSIEKRFYRKLIKTYKGYALFAKAEKITDERSLSKCIRAVQYDYPEFFYVDFRHYSYVPYEDGWEYRPQYLYDSMVSYEKKRQISDLVRRIVQELSKRRLTSVYQKCGYIHSYLVRNCIYDYEALEDTDKREQAYTIEGPLLEKRGVCQGVALAYRLICKECGIDAIVADGVSLRPETEKYERHAWNIVRVGASAAQIDVTWDMCLTLKNWPIRYDYFFLPDIEMMRDHQYVGYPICRKMGESYYEKSQTQFNDLNDMVAFIEKSICNKKNINRPGIYYLQFKIINRSKTEEDIQEYMRNTVSKYIDRGYQFTICTNNAQSVFLYKIEIL